jgi:hypothetical protein
MNKPKRHAALIKAWADGAELQHLHGKDWGDIEIPKWEDNSEYRIKPEKEYPKSSLSDTHLENILRVNSGLCESVTMARIVADAAVAQYVRENEG